MPIQLTREMAATSRLRHVEDALDVAPQNAPPKLDRLLLRPAPVGDKSLGQNLRQDPLIHREFWQTELELVCVAVVPDLLRLRHRFQPGGRIPLDVRWRVGIP